MYAYPRSSAACTQSRIFAGSVPISSEGKKALGFMASIVRMKASSLSWRPTVDTGKRPAHQPGLVAWRDAVRNAEGIDPLRIIDKLDRACPVGAPHAAVDAERVDDATDVIPDIAVGEGLVRERAGAGDLDRDVLVFCQREHLRQL